MKKKSAILLSLTALALSIGAVGAIATGTDLLGATPVAVKAAEETSPLYKLTPTEGKNNSYAGTCDVTIGGVTWNVAGNSTMLPWRIGGKSIENVTRRIYSKTALTGSVSKIEVSFGTNSATVNSAKLMVFGTAEDAANGKNSISEVKLSFEASSTVTVEHPSADAVWKDAFYSFDFNVTVSETKKKFFEFKEAVFYEAEAPSTEPSVTLADGADISVATGELKTVQFDVKNLPEGGAVDFSIEKNDLVQTEWHEATNSLDILGGDALGNVKYTVSLLDSKVNVVASLEGTISVRESLTISGLEDGAILRVGSKVQLDASVLPAGADQNVVWSVSDSKVASISEDGLLSILSHKVSESGFTVTATSVTNSSIYASIRFFTSNEFKISELVSSDGKTFRNGLATGNAVSTKGTITSIEGSSVYIQSEGAAVMLYQLDSDVLKGLKVGDGVKASGKIQLYNGLVELTGSTVTKDDSAIETVEPVTLTADKISGYSDSGVLMEVKGAVCQANRTIGSNSRSFGVNFLLPDGKTSFTAYVKQTSVPYLLETLGFSSFVKNKAYDFTGNKLLFTKSDTITPQLIINEGCKISRTGTDEAQAFVDTYILAKSGAPAEGDTCDAKFAAASAAYEKLSDDAKDVFDTEEKFADAKAILTYWGEHRSNKAGSLQNPNNLAKTKEANNNGAFIATVAILGTASLGLIFACKKKHSK
ncbi:MAG: Ig-like domain-containing protein [bacterium]|nr:Ig-like domain-containing protein [bacterium]